MVYFNYLQLEPQFLRKFVEHQTISDNRVTLTAEIVLFSGFKITWRAREEKDINDQLMYK